MRSNRFHKLTRLLGITAAVVVLAGCSSAPSSAEVYDEARDLGEALTQAVSAAQDAATGFAEPAFASRAIERASSASRQLAQTSANVPAAQLRSQGAQLASIADRVVGQLTQGRIDAAEQIRSIEFVPAASSLADLQRTLPEGATASNSSTGSSLVVAFVIVVMVIGAVAGLLMRASKKAQPAATSGASTTGPQQPPPSHSKERSWDTPHPLYSSPQPETTQPSDDTDASRAAKIRPRDIEVRALLESTLEQVKDRGWEVNLVSPTVHISGDPLRIQRAVLAFLGNAYLAGAERVGIVIDETESGVLLSLGHDAPLEDADAEDVTSRLVAQLGQAVGHEDLDWSLVKDDDVYLATVSLGNSLANLEPAEAGA